MEGRVCKKQINRATKRQYNIRLFWVLKKKCSKMKQFNKTYLDEYECHFRSFYSTQFSVAARNEQVLNSIFVFGFELYSVEWRLPWDANLWDISAKLISFDPPHNIKIQQPTCLFPQNLVEFHTEVRNLVQTQLVCMIIGMYTVTMMCSVGSM